MDSMPTIRELTCPIDDFPKVSEHTFFFDIIMALEKAQWDFKAKISKQTVLLVEDKDKNIVGKISPRDVVRALEPQYDKTNSFTDDIRFGLPQVVESKRKDYFLWQEPFANLCDKAWKITASDMYSRPRSTQSIDIDERIENAFHLFVTTSHEYLYVIENERVVGLLRFFDLYKIICKKIYQCERKSYY
ncbi:CBS domain-containing protein [Desulfonatronum parangueonense]